MDASRFDSVSKLFASRRLSRRQAIGYGTAGVTAAILGAGRFSSVFAQDSATPAATPPTWEEINGQLAAVAPSAALLAAELVDGGSSRFTAYNAGHVSFRSAPASSSGSSARSPCRSRPARSTGSSRSRSRIVYRSVPGGDLRYVRAGTTFTARYLAERMIQKSDNTATDHVLFLVGGRTSRRRWRRWGTAIPPVTSRCSRPAK